MKQVWFWRFLITLDRSSVRIQSIGVMFGALLQISSVCLVVTRDDIEVNRSIEDLAHVGFCIVYPMLFVLSQLVPAALISRRHGEHEPFPRAWCRQCNVPTCAHMLVADGAHVTVSLENHRHSSTMILINNEPTHNRFVPGSTRSWTE